MVVVHLPDEHKPKPFVSLFLFTTFVIPLFVDRGGMGIAALNGGVTDLSTGVAGFDS